MNKAKSMSNIIKFPTFERVQQVINEKLDKHLDEMDKVEIQKEECVELAHYCYQLMDQAIRGNEFVDGFDDMDFLDLKKPEMKDMTAIINMLAAMFYRYQGYEHPFQEILDAANKKLDSMMGGEYFDNTELLQKIEDDIKSLLTEKSDKDDID